MDDVVELKGGRINAVYKGSMEGVKKVIKISSGLYRKTELKRDAEALDDFSKSLNYISLKYNL
ncbi:MAG: hypothetical protein GX163_07090 [Bacteroidetes bacterium]|jgi:predicted Ser/Thr protein kinase|nr:hypothetical protein [Bacteroidota bacterium]